MSAMCISVFCRLIILGLMVAVQTPSGFAADNASEISKPAAVGPLSIDDHRLDTLFADLKRARDADEARSLAEQIRAEFRASPSATIDLLVNNADTAASAKKYNAALDFLDQVVVLDPAYVEGWNRRATIHYLMGNAAKSMADISHVLKLEPRHIGALSGMAGILQDAGLKAQSLKILERYLELYPADRDAQKQAIDLAEDIAGQKT